MAQTSSSLAPAAKAQVSAGQFAQLCETKLKLAPEQATALHTYLDQEVTYRHVLDANGLMAESPDLVTTENEQFDQVMAKLLTPDQLRGYGKLRQTPQAQTYLRALALLPDSPENMAKASKAKQRRTNQMMAQRAAPAD